MAVGGRSLPAGRGARAMLLRVACLSMQNLKAGACASKRSVHARGRPNVVPPPSCCRRALLPPH